MQKVSAPIVVLVLLVVLGIAGLVFWKTAVRPVQKLETGIPIEATSSDARKGMDLMKKLPKSAQEAGGYGTH